MTRDCFFLRFFKVRILQMNRNDQQTDRPNSMLDSRRNNPPDENTLKNWVFQGRLHSNTIR
jgi:hypothetical protein